MAAYDAGFEQLLKKMDKLNIREDHQKIILGGVPSNAVLGFKTVHVRVPTTYLQGMLNIHGEAVQFKFDLEKEILFLKTIDHVEEIPFNKITNLTIEAIEKKEQYSIVGLHFGPEEKAIFWIYWVPSQFINAIRAALLGKRPGF